MQNCNLYGYMTTTDNMPGRMYALEIDDYCRIKSHHQQVVYFGDTPPKVCDLYALEIGDYCRIKSHQQVVYFGDTPPKLWDPPPGD